MKSQLDISDSPANVEKAGVADEFRAFQATRRIELRDQLVCKNLHLVHSVARRFSGLGESLEDLIQEGTIGLLKAVDLFDPDRGVKFNTYACHLITSQIQHYLRDRGRLIRQPAWVQELNTKVSRVSEQLTQELGRSPRLSEVAERLNLAETTVHTAVAARELNSVMSLTTPQDSNQDSEATLVDREKAYSNILVAAEIPVEERILLDEAINGLKTLEQNVVRLFFFEDLNQSEIARKLGISVNYSSYLLRRSIAKIKTVLESQRSEEHAVMQERRALPAAMPTDIPTYDRQTGLYTAAYLRARVTEEIARGKRYPTNFALMLATVRGHVPADNAVTPTLVTIGQLFRQHTRIVDLTAYLDNGQFALLLPHTGREARVLGKRLTDKIAQLPIPPEATTPFTLYLGYAVYPMDGHHAESLFKRADAMLTAAINEDTTL